MESLSNDPRPIPAIPKISLSRPFRRRLHQFVSTISRDPNPLLASRAVGLSSLCLATDRLPMKFASDLAGLVLLLYELGDSQTSSRLLQLLFDVRHRFSFYFSVGAMMGRFELVEKGLEAYPDDSRLLSVREKLRSLKESSSSSATFSLLTPRANFKLDPATDTRVLYSYIEFLEHRFRYVCRRGGEGGINGSAGETQRNRTSVLSVSDDVWIHHILPCLGVIDCVSLSHVNTFLRRMVREDESINVPFPAAFASFEEYVSLGYARDLWIRRLVLHLNFYAVVLSQLFTSDSSVIFPTPKETMTRMPLENLAASPAFSSRLFRAFYRTGSDGFNLEANVMKILIQRERLKLRSFPWWTLLPLGQVKTHDEAYGVAFPYCQFISVPGLVVHFDPLRERLSIRQSDRLTIVREDHVHEEEWWFDEESMSPRVKLLPARESTTFAGLLTSMLVDFHEMARQRVTLQVEQFEVRTQKEVLERSEDEE